MNNLQVGSIHRLPSHVPPPLPQVTFPNHLDHLVSNLSQLPSFSVFSCGNKNNVDIFFENLNLTSPQKWKTMLSLTCDTFPNQYFVSIFQFGHILEL